MHVIASGTSALWMPIIPIWMFRTIINWNIFTHHTAAPLSSWHRAVPQSIYCRSHFLWLPHINAAKAQAAVQPWPAHGSRNLRSSSSHPSRPHSIILKSKAHLIKVRALESSKAALLLLQGHVCDKRHPWHTAQLRSKCSRRAQSRNKNSPSLLQPACWFISASRWLWTLHRHWMHIFLLF